jgi:hypothetical protein
MIQDVDNLRWTQNKAITADRLTEVIECLPRNCEALSSSPALHTHTHTHTHTTIKISHGLEKWPMGL